MATSAVTIDILGNGAPLTQELARVRGQLGIFSNSTNAVASGLTGLTSGIGSVVSRLAVMGGAYLSVQFAVNQFKAAISMGGELSDLSARTGQSVSDLVILRQQFQNAGLGADAVGGALSRMQRAMSGVSEEGEPTAEGFKLLGLNINELEGMTALQQFEALGNAFNGLESQTTKVRAAMSLFGRSGAQMLAIFNDPKSLEVARNQVGGLAETMQQNAAVFDQLDDAWEAVGNRITQLFAGIAQQVAPAIMGIVDSMSELDFTEIGKQIGNVVLVLGQLLEIFGLLLIGITAFVAAQKIVGIFTALKTAVAAMIGPTVAETKALVANTAAQLANANARGVNAAAAARGATAVAGSAAATKAAGAAGAAGAGAAGAASGAAFAAAALAAAAAIGVGIGYWFQKNVFNWASSLAAGGASTEVDQQKAEQMAGDAGLAKLMDGVRGVNTDEEMKAYQKQLTDKIAELNAQMAELGWNETAQKTVLEGDIAALKRFQQSVDQNSEKIIANAEARALAEAQALAEADAKKARADVEAAQREQDFRNSVNEAGSPEEKQAILEAERQRAAALVDSTDPAVTQEARAAAVKKLVDLTQQLHELERDTATQAEKNALKSAELQAQLEMNEAVAYGNEQEKERVKWMQEYKRALEEAKAANMENPEDYARRAADAATQSDRDAAAQRRVDEQAAAEEQARQQAEQQENEQAAAEEQARQQAEQQEDAMATLQRDEARAAGNDDLADKIQQQMDYNDALEQAASMGMDEAAAQEYASRTVAAKAALEERQKRDGASRGDGPETSSLQSIGGGDYGGAAGPMILQNLNAGTLTPNVPNGFGAGNTPTTTTGGTTATVEGTGVNGQSATVISELQKQTGLLERMTTAIENSRFRGPQTGGQGIDLYTV